MQKSGKKIIVSVTNDLVTDQRAHKICSTLLKEGYEPLLIGRKRRASQSLTERTYKTKRMPLLFESSWLFYAEYNVRLFFYLLFSKYDILWANDLDTLPANAVASSLRKKWLCYDCHEYFVELPELVNRPFVKNIWTWLEKRFIHVPNSYSTVSKSIASAYQKRFGIHMHVLNNVPSLSEEGGAMEQIVGSNQKNVILYQGSVNVHRGLEEMIEAMQYINNTELWIVGDGDTLNKLIQLCEELNVKDKVKFLGRVSFSALKTITQQATVGISLEKPIGLNYTFALPNKVFDYIHAGIPVVVSALPEMKKLVEDHKIGLVAHDLQKERLAELFNDLLKDRERLAKYSQKALQIRETYNWENQEPELLSMLGD